MESYAIETGLGHALPCAELLLDSAGSKVNLVRGCGVVGSGPSEAKPCRIREARGAVIDSHSFVESSDQIHYGISMGHDGSS
jgi:hypothetical protein